MTPDSNELLARVEAGAKDDAMREALKRYPVSDPGKWDIDLNKHSRECFLEGFNCAAAAPVPSPDGAAGTNSVPASDDAATQAGSTERASIRGKAPCAGTEAHSDDVRSALADIPVGLWADRIERTTKLVRVQDADSYRSALYAARIDCFYDFEAKKLVSLLRSLAALLALSPVPEATVSEQVGWRLVPKEATPEMVAAAPGHSRIRETWRKMLAAAPAVPQHVDREATVSARAVTEPCGHRDCEFPNCDCETHVPASTPVRSS